MSLYTKKGDAGTTCLADGRKVLKSDLYMQALGDLDELSCWIGMCLCHVLPPQLRATLVQTQMNLQHACSFVADTTSKSHLIQELSQHTQKLEDEMDELERSLPPLRDFVLPKGSPTECSLHICRAVCRRAERSVAALLDEKKVDTDLVAYLNRLSDYLFVAARMR